MVASQIGRDAKGGIGAVSPRDKSTMAQLSEAIDIRPAQGLEELEACVQLQVATWGYDAADIVPRRMFSLAVRIGGQVLGAFANDRLVGFLLALPGVRNGHAYLHSHMLAVVPELRDAGIGRWMKLAQREDALARGIDLIEWTFDPLVVKNAYLNLNCLGAIARRYAPDFYGPTSSPLAGGLPTDRLYAEWWIRSARVDRALHGELSQSRVRATVTVPAAMDAWKATVEGRVYARERQGENARAFEAAFAAGLSALALERHSGGGGTFLLGNCDEPPTL